MKLDLKQILKPSYFGYFLVGAFALAGAIATGTNQSQVRYLERQTQTAFFNLRGNVAPPDNIVILAIDEDSLRQGEFYDPKKRPYLDPFRTVPLKRTIYAQVIAKVLDAGAKAVGVDVFFVTPSVHGPAVDAELQKTLDKYGDRVVLAAQYKLSQTAEATSIQLSAPDAIFKLKPTSLGLVTFTRDVTGNVHNFGTQIDPSSGLRVIPTFADAILKAAKIEYAKPKGNSIYFYGTGNTWLNARQQAPIYYVVDPENWKNQLIGEGKFFKDKIVLIGATAPSMQDIQNTAFGSMPGVEIHANAIAALMNDRSLADLIPDPKGQGLLIFGLVGILGLALSRIKRPFLQFGIVLIVAGAWLGASYYCFTYANLILPTAVPVIALGLSGLSLLVTGGIEIYIENLKAQKDKRLLRKAFERYVAPTIVEEIVSNAENFRDFLEGKTIKAAVLFSDIRGFTTLSSRVPAPKLVPQLNVYLGGMVDAITEYQGTIDKFIGDAVMAEFGSPVSRGEEIDAMNAIYAALNMRKVLSELRLAWQQEGKIPFSNGIGINYGEVMVGNIGSPSRLEYAVIGDTVNVASRVEGMTKDLGTDILITEALYEIVKDKVEVEDFGNHQLKGRVGEIHLYGLIGLKGDSRELYQQVQLDLKRHMAVINVLKDGKLPT
ncbi:adenylate/guanylate cyclase domain-containing protein [Tumidithrix elongata RA019]|uniref:Adenylate/guanylate cyclase domain-containing protein n=1 Tax=Tumidithrix elongata BACA0141 TaxID=2716417 RepID=A0AAW9PYD5_9CYAN|nr:adenylate/guanylate cyclase domain-containing protein [Tumidithrix elongata RA019]